MKIRNFVSIKGTGKAVPSRIISNQFLHENLGTDLFWPETHLGIKQRFWSEHETVVDLGASAALEALNKSNMNKDSIDLIIVATSSPDKLSPSVACQISNRLNMNCPAFDINAVCSGFVYGIHLATALITSNMYKNILLVATETYSKITDTESRDCVYFGDGAGAAILTQSKTGWIASDIFSDSSGIDGFYTYVGGTFKMDGKAVYQAGTKYVPEAINQLLSETGYSINDIKYLIPHQPGINVLKGISEKINMPFSNVKTIMDRYGNTAGASIAIALDELASDNKIQPDDMILLATIGSGWTWGTALIKWE